MTSGVKYVLDTNTLSALMEADANVLAHLQQVEPASVAMPQPALAEIMYGIERLPRSRRKEKLRANLQLLLSQVTRLAWSDEVSHMFASVKAMLERRGQPIEDFDVAIAAHAVGDNVVLVTTDAKHMSRVPGITIEDWSRPKET
jgi:tRNA(fMet)-specific endonuclease VapC